MLNLPRSLRHDQPPADRLIELEKWSRDLQDPGWLDSFTLQVLDRVVRARAEETMRLNEEIDAHRRLRARLRALIQARQQLIGGLKASLDARRRLIGELRSSLAEERRRVQDLRRQIQAIQDSRSWRLLTRLGRMKSRILGSSK